MFFLASFTFTALGFSWMLQVVLWRRFPKLIQFKNIFLVFLSVSVMAILLLFFLLHGGKGIEINMLIIQLLQFAFCYWVLALSYISFYSLIHYDSPSVAIVMEVNKHRNGIAIDQVAKGIDKIDVIGIRIRELEKDNYIEVVDDQCFLKAKGLYTARIFDFGKKFFGLSAEG